MSAPAKPWERPGVNYQNNASIPGNTMSASPVGPDHIQAAAVSRTANPVPSVASTPPQLPPRPSQQSQLGSRLGPGIGTGLGYGGYGGYGGLSSFGSPMGYGGYGGLYNSPYSNYGGYGGYNRMGPDMHSTFARHAEESSRPAFESIESIVNAVNSVGMMLDSTFQAVYNSFRAVIGVADNFTRLKSQLVQVFSALAFIRTLKYIFRKLLELIRLRPKGEADQLWRKAFEEAAAASTASPGGGPKKSAWPILLFFGIIMGGPYLIWRVISAFSSGSTDEKGWAKGEDDHFVARANFSFQGQGTDELSFSAGQNINVAPKEIQPHVRGWLLASVDGERVGMIPANYVQVLGKRRGSRNTETTQAAPLVQSESSISLSRESQFPSSTPARNMAAVPENELESAFSSDNLVSSQTTDNIASSLHDSSNQEAADILNDIEN